MIFEWLSSLGPWGWIAFGGVLLALEILVPGVFLLWFGIAAILTGGLSMTISPFIVLAWQAQVVIFLVLSVASALIGRRFFPADKPENTDQPLLNQRAQQLIGRTATLEEPIAEGRGRVRLGDTLWRVSGPDLPAGSRVRVTAASGNELTVVADQS